MILPVFDDTLKKWNLVPNYFVFSYIFLIVKNENDSYIYENFI